MTINSLISDRTRRLLKTHYRCGTAPESPLKDHRTSLIKLINCSVTIILPQLHKHAISNLWINARVSPPNKARADTKSRQAWKYKINRTWKIRILCTTCIPRPFLARHRRSDIQARTHYQQLTALSAHYC